MLKRLLLILSLLVCSAAAQNSRFDGIVLNRNGMPLAGASIAVCLQPVTGTVPCTNPAPLCSSASDAVCTSPNPVTADSLGNYFGYVKPGKYTLQFYGSGLTTRSQADQILACDPSMCYLSASITFTPLADPACSAGLLWYSLTTTGRLKWCDAALALHSILGNDTTDALSNKSISGSTNTLTNIPTAALVANAATQDAGAALQSDFSTSSATFVDVTGGSFTITTTGGDVLIFFSGPAHAATADGQLAINGDGSDSPILASLTAGGQTNLPVSVVYRYTAVTAASHTFKLRAKCNGGTLTMNMASKANGYMTVIELKR